MTPRAHWMPFGAEVRTEGDVRFRLWAPQARRVDLCLEAPHAEQRISMQGRAGGWFEVITDRAMAGSHYRFQVDGDMRVPDPASRFQPLDVHGPSEVIDPRDFRWQDLGWRGRPWEEVVIYELHVGSFTSEGTFQAVKRRLDYLQDLGVTAIELMPVSDFPGARNWGYDGVLPFAPDSRYGRPDDLKELIETAHGKGLMVFLDVVYNHFGPEGNYLHVYAPAFFTDRHRTPWGAAINYDGENSRTVRDFFVQNALFWLEEYHFDGLRLDAVHAIADDSQPDVLEELAVAVQQGPGADREVHLVLENDNNAAHYLRRNGSGRPLYYVAQWNDDIHHALHVLLTGETSGYYSDYADDPCRHLGRCLTEGFAYQGEVSEYRDGAKRGEPSRFLPAPAFVSFLQNHDQIGNRAFGDRMATLAKPAALRAATAVLLLAPSPPLLFMGQELAATQPFLFFCDFGPDLAQAVTEGRRREFVRFPEFSDPQARERIPDPSDPATFQQAVLDWDRLAQGDHRRWLAFHRRLLELRRSEIAPRLGRGTSGTRASYRCLPPRGLLACWTLADGAHLLLAANLGGDPLEDLDPISGRLLFATHDDLPAALEAGRLPPWSVAWFLPGQSRLVTLAP